MNVFLSISVHQCYQWLLKMKAYRLKPWLITVHLERLFGKFEDMYKAMASQSHRVIARRATTGLYSQQDACATLEVKPREYLT